MSSPTKFVRTPALWTLYALLGLYAFFQNAIGPSIPLLQKEFHFDYTMAALHISAFAFGMVGAGLLSSGLIRRLGLNRALWGGQLGTLAGLSVVVLAPTPWVSLGAILFAGFTGTVSLAAVQTSVSAQAGPFRPKALLEANIAASLTSAAGPFVLVVGTWTGTGWRTLWPAFVLALGVTALLGYRSLARNLAAPESAPKDLPGRLGLGYLRAWLLIFFGVAVEWSAGYWAAAYLAHLPGGSLGLAAAGAGVFQLAAVVSRTVTSRLTSRFGEKRLLLGAVAVMAAGFPLYWTLWTPVTAFAGLALLGAGAAVFYPTGLSLSIGAAGTQPAKAASLATAASGSAMLVGPLVLGAVADATSLQTALLAIPLGLAVMVGLLLVGRKG